MIWKTIPGFSDYEASGAGEIRRVRGKSTKSLPYICTQTVSSHGYRVISAFADGDRKRTTYVHRLVALAFYGVPEGDLEVAHGDGDRSNNRKTNLRWASTSANQMDRVEHGTSNRGKAHGMAVLTEQDVREMRSLRSSGMTYSKIAMRFAVKEATCYYAVSGRNWKHLD